MKRTLVCTAALAMFLVGCSDDTATVEEVEKPTEQQQKPVPADEAISEEQLADLIEQASNEAFSTTEHEGSIAMQETHSIDEQVQNTYYYTSNYGQNEEKEGMYGEHQLYYKETIDSYDDGAIILEGYVQPNVAFYTYRNGAGWNGYDFQKIGEIGYERLSYLSPADVLSMLEMNPTSMKLVSVSDEIVTTTFEPTEEDEVSLLFSILEPESMYHKTDLLLQVKHVEIQLQFNRSNEVLEGLHVQFVFENAENEKETLIIAYEQQFTSYQLTDEIRPPEEVFKEAGLTLWD